MSEIRPEKLERIRELQAMTRKELSDECTKILSRYLDDEDAKAEAHRAFGKPDVSKQPEVAHLMDTANQLESAADFGTGFDDAYMRPRPLHVKYDKKKRKGNRRRKQKRG